MAITEERFNKLVQRVKRLEDHSTSQTGARADVPIPKAAPILAWIPGIAALVALLGVGVPVALHLNTRIDSVKTEVGGLATKLDKLDAAVKTLSSQQSDQTQRLIHELLASATTAESTPTAAKALEIASQLTATLRQEKRPASPDFFQAAVTVVRQNKRPDLKKLALQTQQQLAEYRSALQAPQTIGTVFTCSPSFRGRYWMVPGKSPEGVSDVTISDCPQILDNVIWKNVVFRNSRIIYRGGPVGLTNVVFVNCTFDVQDKESVASILDYAALGKRELHIGRLPNLGQ